jgi:hypothetical protein
MGLESGNAFIVLVFIVDGETEQLSDFRHVLRFLRPHFYIDPTAPTTRTNRPAHLGLIGRTATTDTHRSVDPHRHRIVDSYCNTFIVQGFMPCRTTVDLRFATTRTAWTM